MIKKWGFTILGSVAVLGILLFALQQIFIKTTLSEQEIINRVESLYNGSVEDITKTARHYNVVFSDGTKVYEVVVDEEQGTFRDLTLLADRGGAIAVTNETEEGAANETETPDSKEPTEATPYNSNAANSIEKPIPTPPPANTVKPPATGNSGNSSGNGSTQQTEQPSTPPPAKPANPVRITESAATQIALKQLNGDVEDIEFYSAADGGYYIVEIETEQQEAAFQIHAITGKILSVVYDD